MSAIQLRCKVFPLAFLLYLFKPRCSVDGGPEQILRWGENTLPVPPGRHSLRVWYKYITGPTNVADTVVDVPPQGVGLVYKTRWMIFLPGILEPTQGYGQAMPYGQQPQASLPYGQQPQPGALPQQPHAAQQYAPQGAAGAAGAAPAAQPQAPPAGWNPDPSGRHQHRYWDGARWTASVADNGVTTEDPL
jgi:hypothetical protein